MQITPVKTTTRLFGKCATYDLDSEKSQLNRIKIRSPLDIIVLLHDKNQQNIHRELSIFYHLQGLKLILHIKLSKHIYFLGDHNIRVSLSKTSALNTVSRPCYEGNDFGHQEYLRLVQLVKEGFTSLRDHYPVLRLLLFIGEVWLFVTLHTQEIQGWCRTL